MKPAIIPYLEQISHPLWQKKRLEVLQANDFCCEYCGSDEKTLHVHHPYYEKGKKAWEYPTKFLKCLCKDCHKEEHLIDEKLKRALSELQFDVKTEVLGYIQAIVAIENFERSINNDVLYFDPKTSDGRDLEGMAAALTSRKYPITMDDLFVLFKCKNFIAGVSILEIIETTSDIFETMVEKWKKGGA